MKYQSPICGISLSEVMQAELEKTVSHKLSQKVWSVFVSSNALALVEIISISLLNPSVTAHFIHSSCFPPQVYTLLHITLVICTRPPKQQGDLELAVDHSGLNQFVVFGRVSEWELLEGTETSKISRVLFPCFTTTILWLHGTLMPTISYNSTKYGATIFIECADRNLNLDWS